MVIYNDAIFINLLLGEKLGDEAIEDVVPLAVHLMRRRGGEEAQVPEDDAAFGEDGSEIDLQHFDECLADNAK